MDDASRIGVLLLEDSILDAELVTHALRREIPAIDVIRVATREQYVAALSAPQFDAILSDFSLPGWDGMEALAIARAAVPALPFLFVSGVLGEENAVDSLRLGATDYVLKHRLGRLAAALRRALSESREQRERQAAEAHLRLLVAEMSHRVKNTLATVQSLAAQTGRMSQDLPTFQARFMGRLLALSEAHGLLFTNDWKQTSLGDVVASCFVPFPHVLPHRWHSAGPPVLLAPKSTLALALLLHEAAANAVQHGALSSPEGVVDIAWTSEAGQSARWTVLDWHERGGPKVTVPEKRGFGTRLIERSAAYELDGEARLDFDTDGLRLRLKIAA